MRKNNSAAIDQYKTINQQIYCLAEKLAGSFIDISKRRILEDLSKEEGAINCNGEVYVNHCLHTRLLQAATVHAASDYLEIYPRSVERLVEMGRVEPFSERIKYLVMKSSLKKCKENLNENERRILDKETTNSLRPKSTKLAPVTITDNKSYSDD